MASSDRIEFPGHSGGMLAARLDRPTGRARGTALFAHCFSCSKDVLAARRMAAGLQAQGLTVLRFDFTGLGLSEGDFVNTSFTTNVHDLIAAAQWLATNEGGPDLMIGHSLGGTASIVAAAQLPMVRAVATIGAPANADHVLRQFSPQLADIEKNGVADVTLGGRTFQIAQSFVEDVRTAKVRDAIVELRRPILIMHAPTDDIVALDNASGLFTAARHPKSFVSLDGADHLLTRPEDAAFAAEILAAWAGRYLPSRGLSPAPPPPTGEEMVRVSEAGGKYTNWVVTAQGHAVLADEPESLGGSNLGPDPYSYLQAALAACTSITLRMYADRKAWPLKGVDVATRYAREHLPDCEDCEAGVKVDVIERRITLSGSLDADQRARLLAIADKCPVHQTLERSVKVRTVLTGEA